MPVITIIGVEFAFLFGGLVVTEAVFTLPGVGRYLVDAIHHRDYTVIQAIVLIMAVIVSFANLAVDIAVHELVVIIVYGGQFRPIKAIYSLTVGRLMIVHHSPCTLLDV